MQLRPTKVIVFGNPKVGTRLMQGSQSAALDLPLRLSIWEDARNRVWVGYHAWRAWPPNMTSRTTRPFWRWDARSRSWSPGPSMFTTRA